MIDNPPTADTLQSLALLALSVALFLHIIRPTKKL